MREFTAQKLARDEAKSSGLQWRTEILSGNYGIVRFTDGAFVLSADDADFRGSKIKKSAFICEICGFKTPFPSEN